MKTLTILYIGRNQEITDTMNRLLNAREEWKGITTCLEEEALVMVKDIPIDLVLLGNGISAAAEEKLRADLIRIRPALKIIQHYGGGSGLLYSEIMTAIA
ncbi:hypothetical protein FBD94_14990 [Pedobacter hiemivivus]|uniref:Response regulator receiver protein n=1 Tax=Pedobacter hiemivivus TaxID=2530454 RepID=A0A4U1G8P7_9SPHI|nr:hypothetical protein [Pedobacter hiemivivus]TKC60215.1 hypothetical protein FBD94_14990 [Pedobacter hiemivivus]